MADLKGVLTRRWVALTSGKGRLNHGIAQTTLRLADIPEKKSDLVKGSYLLPAQEKAAAIAVKITDMLGEEVLIVSEAAAR